LDKAPLDLLQERSQGFFGVLKVVAGQVASHGSDGIVSAEVGVEGRDDAGETAGRWHVVLVGELLLLQRQEAVGVL
jgi:hypothetical protein